MKLVFFKIENYTGYVIILTKRVCGCTVWSVAPTRYDPMGCSLPGSSVHEISQARILGWVVISSSSGPSWSRDRAHVFCLGKGILYHWTTREAPVLWLSYAVLSRSVVSNSLWPMACSLPGSSVHGDSPGKNIWVGFRALLQGIFPNQGSNPDLPCCRWILYSLSHQGILWMLEWVAYPFSRASSQPRNQTGVSCTAGRFFTSWATREAVLEFKSEK